MDPRSRNVPSFVSLRTGRLGDLLRMTGSGARTCLEGPPLFAAVGARGPPPARLVKTPAAVHPLARGERAGESRWAGGPGFRQSQMGLKKTPHLPSSAGLSRHGGSATPRRGRFNPSMNRCAHQQLPGEPINRSSDNGVTHYPVSVIGGLDTMDEGNCMEEPPVTSSTPPHPRRSGPPPSCLGNPLPPRRVCDPSARTEDFERARPVTIGNNRWSALEKDGAGG
jgi:hypothetical protein